MLLGLGQRGKRRTEFARAGGAQASFELVGDSAQRGAVGLSQLAERAQLTIDRIAREREQASLQAEAHAGSRVGQRAQFDVGRGDVRATHQPSELHPASSHVPACVELEGFVRCVDQLFERCG